MNTLTRWLLRKSFFLKMRTRDFFWRYAFAHMGKDSHIYGKITAYYPERIFVGDHCSLNEGVMLNARADITIGDYVHISPGCMIHAGGLDYRKTGAERGHLARLVVIKDGVWIGAGAIVVPGVTIGENSVIGAGSVVSKDIPPNVVAVGIPAVPIRNIAE